MLNIVSAFFFPQNFLSMDHTHRHTHIDKHKHTQTFSHTGTQNTQTGTETDTHRHAIRYWPQQEKHNLLRTQRRRSDKPRHTRALAIIVQQVVPLSRESSASQIGFRVGESGNVKSDMSKDMFL